MYIRLPEPLIVAPKTWSPGFFCTGRLSPVSMDSSTDPEPSLTIPSTGKRSPGRTITTSPTITSSTDTVISPFLMSLALSGFISMSDLIEPAARLRAFDSSNLPSRTRPMIAQEASKYVCPSPIFIPARLKIVTAKLYPYAADVPTATKVFILLVRCFRAPHALK